MIVSDPIDSGLASLHDDRMSKLEVIRAALLAIVGVAFLAFDLFVVYGMPAMRGNAPVVELLAVLQGELAIVLAGVFLWPGQRWLRLMWGGFATAVIWFALVRLVSEAFMSQASFLTRLVIAALMVLSFCFPCATFFVCYRKIVAKRLSLLGRRWDANPQLQFGLRQLLVATACFAVVAFAARAVCPDRWAGQLDWDGDATSNVILSALYFFPACVAGPIFVAIMRPSAWSILILPCYLLVVFGEMMVISQTTLGPVPTAQDVLYFAFSVNGYAQMASVMLVAGVLARVGGLKLEQFLFPQVL